MTFNAKGGRSRFMKLFKNQESLRSLKKNFPRTVLRGV